jgi:hypothetical protein
MRRETASFFFEKKAGALPFIKIEKKGYILILQGLNSNRPKQKHKCFSIQIENLLVASFLKASGGQYMQWRPLDHPHQQE